MQPSLPVPPPPAQVLSSQGDWPAPCADACVCAGLLSRLGCRRVKQPAGRDVCSNVLACNPSTLTHPMCAGAGTHVRKCIIDKNARIGSNVRIVNEAGVREANREEEGFVIKDGIVVVIKDTIIPDGTVI